MVSVAICTWNRSKLLDQTLARMAELRVPPGVEWELLVVNNNSPDDTDAVIARHAAAGRLPIRPLFETRQGQSHARNCAIEAARGEYIVWTDDDVLVDRNWLACYVGAFRTWPEATYFGGPIYPWYERTPPSWLRDILWECKHLWALLDLGKETRPLQVGESPFGANMAVRGDVQRRHRFDPRRGHVGGGLAGGDETTLFDQLQAEGQTGVWVADALVQHFVPAGRMSVSYVRDRASQYGYQNHDPAKDVGSKRVFGLPGYALRQYCKFSLLKYLYPLVSRRSWATALYQSARWGGVLRRIRDQRAAGQSA